jgi:hypothetical protein
MNKYSRILMVFAVLLIYSICNGEFQKLDWRLRVSFGYSKFHQLHLHYGVALHQIGWGAFTRSLDPIKPGDYFADHLSQSKTIDSITLNSIVNEYQQHFRDLPIDLFKASLYWCSDTLHGPGKNKVVIRNEYFFRYTDGTCVYVLSGWWPNFIKLFKAYPGDNKLDINQLNKEISHFTKNESTLKRLVYSDTASAPFFLVQAHSDNFLIRHYNINAMHVEGREHGADLNQPPPMFAPRYSIIEITYYLNKDFIP